MKQSYLITIPFIHPSLNQWAVQWDKYKRYSEKKRIEEYMHYELLDAPNFLNEVCITVTYFMPSKRRCDPDNYSPKFFMDGLVGAGVIKDDSSKYVKSLTIIMDYDKNDPRSEILIEEV